MVTKFRPRTFDFETGLFQVAFFSALYFLTALATYTLFSLPDGRPSMWLPQGVFIAALVLGRREYRAILLVSQIVTDLLTQYFLGTLPLVPALMVNGLFTLHAIMAAALFLRFHPRRLLDFGRLNSTLHFLAWLGVIPSVVVGLITAILWQGIVGTPFITSWIWWATGGSLSACIVIPILATLFQTAPRDWFRTFVPNLEAGLLFLMLLATTAFSTLYGNIAGASLPPYVFLPFLLLIWSALRLPPAATLLICSVFALFALWLDLRFSAQDTSDIRTSIAALKLLLLLLVCSALTSAALLAERVRDSIDLENSEQRLRHLISVAPYGIIVSTRKCCVFANATAAEILGLPSPLDIMGRKASSFMHPDYRERAEHRLHLIVSGEETNLPRVENVLIDARGRETVVEASATAIEWDGEPAMLGMINDIADRKRADEAMRRAQRMEAIGQLTGGIAHDFNNILGIIIGNLELVEDEVADHPEVKRRVALALAAVSRGTNITEKLLGFSRRKSHTRTLTDTNAFILGLRDLITLSLTASISVEIQPGEDVSPVEVDPGDLQDALINLTLNARDAMPRGGTLVIETANVTLDADYVLRNPEAREGDYVMIAVSDTGIGMEPEVAERVFEPFFSTKSRDKGSGLGLSMVYGFVQRSRGHVKIYSEPDAGTTFRMYFPLPAPRHQQEAPASQQSSPLPRGTECILIVDDEPSFLDIAAHNLRNLGYQVRTAGKGADAVRLLEEMPEIDMLLSDVVMPGGMDGYQLALEARRRRPDLPILLTSGFTQKRETFAHQDQQFVDVLARELLAKPYTREQLAQAVRATLDRRSRDADHAQPTN